MSLASFRITTPSSPALINQIGTIEKTQSSSVSYPDVQKQLATSLSLQTEMHQSIPNTPFEKRLSLIDSKSSHQKHRDVHWTPSSWERSIRRTVTGWVESTQVSVSDVLPTPNLTKRPRAFIAEEDADRSFGNMIFPATMKELGKKTSAPKPSPTYEFRSTSFDFGLIGSSRSQQIVSNFDLR